MDTAKTGWPKSQLLRETHALAAPRKWRDIEIEFCPSRKLC
jgi:hypothetical protein